MTNLGWILCQGLNEGIEKILAFSATSTRVSIMVT